MLGCIANNISVKLGGINTHQILPILPPSQKKHVNYRNHSLLIHGEAIFHISSPGW